MTTYFFKKIGSEIISNERKNDQNKHESLVPSSINCRIKR
jgi:hypothetical protein